MRNDKSPGYTLLEIIAVVAIMGLLAALAAPVVLEKTDQKKLEGTLESMEELTKAVMGTTSDRVRGEVKFAGYVEDMGELPGLYEIKDESGNPVLQPKALWTSDPAGTPGNEEDDLISYKTYSYKQDQYDLEFIRVGWRGPYISPPACGILKDGWGSPFVFENINGDLVIKSLGADGREGGKGYDQDVACAVKKSDYQGSVSGYVSYQNVVLEDCEDYPIEIRIYHKTAARARDNDCKTVRDCLDYIKTIAEPDGYFRLEDVPIGTQRLLLATQDGKSLYEISVCKGYKIAAEPGTMWLGTLGFLH